MKTARVIGECLRKYLFKNPYPIGKQTFMKDLFNSPSGKKVIGEMAAIPIITDAPYGVCPETGETIVSFRP